MPILSTFVNNTMPINIPSERIFDAEKIEKCTLRMAYQIYEANFGIKKLFLIGIAENGLKFALQLKKQLEAVSPLEVELHALSINKKDPLNKVTLSIAKEEIQNQSVVVIDDVLNTGSTLMYAVKHLLDVRINQLNTAVLVNRNHKRYPIKADFKGVSLSTSINEHVAVVLEGDNAGIFLS